MCAMDELNKHGDDKYREMYNTASYDEVSRVSHIFMSHVKSVRI